MHRIRKTWPAAARSILGGRIICILVGGGVALGTTLSPAAAATAPTCRQSCITEFPVPIPVVYNGPFGIAKGFGDDMWFGDQDTVDRVDRDGNFVQYAVPSSGAGVGWVTRGTDGAMWFVERFTNKLGRVDNLGQVTEFAIPTASSVPQGVVMDGNGIVWFTEQAGNRIGRLDPVAGAFTEYAVPTPHAGAQGLALGPDGALWFTERNAAKIGRMDQAGSFTEYPLLVGSSPQRITVGPDGAVWFTELRTSMVGRITVDGELHEYALAAGSQPVGIAAADGALWAAEFGSDKIARVAVDGTVTDEFAVPSASAAPFQVAAGSNRAVWFTESFQGQNGNRVARLDPYTP
jgi:virginiamycin B lyase